MATTCDALIIGGGAIGLSIARRLAREKLRVALIDQGRLGQESSWAAAGMLTLSFRAGTPEPFRRLSAASLAMHADLAAALREETGIDVGHARSGTLQLLFDAKDAAEAEEIASVRRADGLVTERLAARDVWEREPAVSKTVQGAHLHPEAAQVRNPWLGRALAVAAQRAGAELREGTPAHELIRRGDRIIGVRAGTETIEAKTTVIAAGAWSGAFASALGTALPVQPARGQMLLLEAFPPLLRHLVHRGSDYIASRGDGKILVGSTVEFVGFVKDNTAEAVHTLVRKGLQMVPHLGTARFVRAWAGLRPHTPDGLPYLGPVPGREGVLLATGHFRNGILLAPVTAEIVAALVLEKKLDFDLSPFRAGRG